MKKEKLVRFKWMGAYWSCTPAKYQELLDCASNEQPIDMEGCKELRSRPRSFQVFSDIISHRTRE